MSISRTAATTLCLLILAAFPCNAPAQAGKPVEKWEYGELHHHKNSGGGVGPDKVFTPAVDWISGGGFVRVYGWEGMADKLEAPALKKDAVKDAKKGTIEAVHRIRLLNHLGDQGWELIAHERSEKSGESLWIFKRRVGK